VSPKFRRAAQRPAPLSRLAIHFRRVAFSRQTSRKPRISKQRPTFRRGADCDPPDEARIGAETVAFDRFLQRQLVGAHAFVVSSRDILHGERRSREFHVVLEIAGPVVDLFRSSHDNITTGQIVRRPNRSYRVRSTLSMASTDRGTRGRLAPPQLWGIDADWGVNPIPYGEVGSEGAQATR